MGCGEGGGGRLHDENIKISIHYSLKQDKAGTWTKWNKIGNSVKKGNH